MPQLRGTVYTMGRQNLLLILSTPEVSPRYAFVVDLSRKAIGVAFLPRYRRLGRCALVHSETLEGYCETCSGLAADFSTSGDSTAITVTGWFDRFVNPEKNAESPLKRSLIYQKRIVLKPRKNNAWREAGLPPMSFGGSRPRTWLADGFLARSTTRRENAWSGNDAKESGHLKEVNHRLRFSYVLVR